MSAFFNQLLTKSPLCLCCGYQKNAKQGFCLGCYHDLPHIKTPCLQCWPFAACLSAFEYQFPINELIFQYKSQARLALCDSFAQALITQIKKQQHPLPQVLMPVPLHPNKLKQRGFNQSLELAKVLSKQLHIPIDYHSLQSTQQTTQQKSLNKQQRLVNVQSSYALTRPLSVTHIALIDDVITTGATTKTLAYLLREHGATQIQAWSIARTASFNS